MVFQEQSLLTNLTVGENIYLGNEAQFTRFGIVDWRALYAAAARQLAKVQVDVDPRMRADDLDFATRQMVELAKALTLEEHARRPSRHPARRADLGSRARRDRDPFRPRPGAEVARLLHLRLPPARRGAGALRPHLRHEGRRRGRRPRRRRGRRHRAASSHGRPQPAGRVLSRAAAEAVSRRVPVEADGLSLGQRLSRRQLQAPCRRDPRHCRRHRLGPRRADAHACRLRAARRRPPVVGGREVQLTTPAEAVDLGIGYVPRDRRVEGLVLFLPVAANITLAGSWQPHPSRPDRRARGAAAGQRVGSTA